MTHDSDDRFLSRADSTYLYGIAILLMILHHCFLDPARLHHNYVSIFGSCQLLETRIAWAWKICVAIYAFLSGYAFNLKRARKQNLMKNLMANSCFVLKQGVRFYGKVLLVVCIFLPIGVLFYNRETSPLRFLQSVFLGKYINGEWWYIRKYLVFLLSFPFAAFALSLFERLLRRCRNAVLRVLLFVLCLSALFVVIWNPFSASAVGRIWEHLLRSTLGDYYLIFIEGILVSRYALFSRFHRFLRARLPGPRMLLGLSAAGVFLVLLIRALVVQEPADSGIDLILAPIFIFLSAEVRQLARKKQLPALFCFFGRYSTYMWLTHTFFLYYYWQPVVLLPRYSILIYLWTVLLSLLAALILDGLYRVIRRLTAACRKRVKWTAANPTES